SALPTSDVAASVEDCAGELAQRWREQRPDIVHTFGIVATLAAVKAAVDGPPPIVATFDESPSHSEIESRIAGQVAAVMPLSLEERDHWRRTGVRTLWTGPFPFTVPVPDADSGADADGDVVTMTTGQDLEATVASMPSWKGRLVVAARVAPSKVTALRARAQKLGVWDRIRLRPALQGAEREEMWSEAAVVVAGRGGSRHGGQVLEAAAHGVPAIAVEAGAHVDHVVPGTTGVLVPPNANARSLGRAVSSVVSNGFGLRAMGASAPSLAGEAADRTRTLSRWLENTEASDMLASVEDFGRRRPAMLILGSVLAGLATGRLTRGMIDERTASKSDADTTDIQIPLGYPTLTPVTPVTPAPVTTYGSL
ncbi:MAG TPA: glycosyltransferase family 4 protein, partial [Dermatophilaceae bacterium]|nr:glycosyltransferase family 4 protein [Dermatophilaceae bacterium]